MCTPSDNNANVQIEESQRDGDLSAEWLVEDEYDRLSDHRSSEMSEKSLIVEYVDRSDIELSSYKYSDSEDEDVKVVIELEEDETQSESEEQPDSAATPALAVTPAPTATPVSIATSEATATPLVGSFADLKQEVLSSYRGVFLFLSILVVIVAVFIFVMPTISAFFVQVEKGKLAIQVNSLLQEEIAHLKSELTQCKTSCKVEQTVEEPMKVFNIGKFLGRCFNMRFKGLQRLGLVSSAPLKVCV
ncbi:hypothetical protein M3Y98_01039500 [Aphelenchoides besseyi]|nr:hypothetical protein M3Y98_01039500 [Aphelenchoides besseyi]KAI6209901.1 hypothetical protein M3Y96_00270200 [Aphelenchoides besseyi]